MDRMLTTIMVIKVAINDFYSLSPEVRSIILDRYKINMLLGTYGSEIFEVALNFEAKTIDKITTLMQGHFSLSKKSLSEVSGLCVLPDDVYFVTTGDDSTLRMWKTSSRRQERLFRFDIDTKEQAPQTIAASPNSKFLAIGFKDGSIAIFDLDKWEVVHKTKEATACVCDLKFSPDGRYIAGGLNDGTIQVYEFPQIIKKLTLKGNSNCIKHLDWAMNSTLLRSESADAELLFWNIESGEEVKTGAKDYRDEPWATWTCTIGWSVQGIWSRGYKKVISVCDRSSFSFDNYQLLAVGNYTGITKLYRYPCINKGAEALEIQGHSAQITNIKFDGEGKYLFSTGGEDRCVFQWKLK